MLEWVACLFSSRSSRPRNWTGVSCIADGFFTSWATREAHKETLGILWKNLWPQSLERRLYRLPCRRNKLLQCVRVCQFPDVDFSFFHRNWIPQYSSGTRLPQTKAIPISATFLPVCFKKYSYREAAPRISLVSVHYCCLPSWTLTWYGMKVKHRESIKQKNLNLWHHGSFTYLTWTMYSFWVST